ncbi:MAG: fatty acid--CoA ligase family protein, partial [Microbacterium sp.]
MGIELLLEMAAGSIDRPVIGRRSESLTPAALRAHALRGSQLVREAGADAILYVAGNGPEFATALFAAAYAGVPLVPLNYRLGPEQLSALARRHPDAYVIVHPASIAAGTELPSRVVPIEEWRESVKTAPEGDVRPALTDDGDAAAYIYTSGTTSEPKGVILHHSNLISYVLGTTDFASAAPEDAALMSVPPYHIAGVANVLTNLYTGRRLVPLERFDAQTWIETVREEGITSAFVVPTMLSRIVHSIDEKTMPSLRSVSYGGAPMPSSVIMRALELWPTVDFVNAYGLTETSSTVALLGPEDHRLAFASDDPAVRARLSSVGRPLPGVTLEIRREDGEVLPAGEVGRIHLSGDQVSGEYAGTGKATDERSFFDTRDLGYIDHEGYVFILGRADDTIIRGAENIAPAEI